MEKAFETLVEYGDEDGGALITGAIDIVRQATRGERASYKGRVYELPLPGGEGKALRSAAKPQPDIPIYLATLSPKSLEMTGEIADGWLGTSFMPEHARVFFDHLEAGARRAGRSLASLDLRNQIVIAELVAELARANSLTVLLIAHDINPLLPIVDRVLYVAHGGVAIGRPAEVITTEQLSRLYDAPIEVLHDSHGHMFVVGLEAESAHHDA